MVDAFTKKLSNQLFILNSMQVNAPVEEKEVKNQDPRNGKEIPGKRRVGLEREQLQIQLFLLLKDQQTITN